MILRELTAEVLVADEPILTLTRDDIAALKARAFRNPRLRIRVCAHHSVQDAVHEMLIVMIRGCYIRPHKHASKSESFHLVEGALDVVIFDEKGPVTKVFPLGDHASGSAFYYRSNIPLYHTVVVRSEVAVFHETTRGPFRQADNILAPWSPDERDSAAVTEFLHELDGRLARLTP